MRSDGATGSRVERVLTLRTFGAFTDLSPAELAVMAEHANERFFPAGSVMFRPGLPVSGLHLVVKGKVDILKNGAVIRTMTDRESVGGLAALTADPHGMHAVAREDTSTLELSREDMEDVFEDNFQILFAVMRVLSRTLVHARSLRGPTAGYPPASDDAQDGPVGALDPVDRIFHLVRTLNFPGARLEAIADLARSAQRIDLPAGAPIWRAGEASNFFICVLRGKITCASTFGQTFAFDSGSVVGGLDSVGRDPRWFDATAQTPVTALSIETSKFLDVLEDHAEMAMGLMRVIASSIDQQFTELAAEKAATETAP